MSTAKLTLRPPPNVDFVQGYPGIPSGPERVQAAVKGTIELRAGNQGVKAKWVRIELRKVETLPGGGQANTFFDFVGQSPVNVWQTSDEYAVLYTQDFPFYIRIPESIPPSLALEKNAGVRYELVAQVCIKAKKGFFRRDKSTILTTVAPIVIDKHELHSVWPLYQQPEARQIRADGVTLVVERDATCYGPGDRLSVMATLRCDAPAATILRGFEFALKEATVFRPTGKKAAPQVRVVIVGEQKVPVNATLYGGQQHRAELNCVIPATHTTTTLASARHIDITYTLTVKALMGSGKPVQGDLPVVVSNWPRGVSIEAVRRIGPTPNLSLLGANGQPITPSHSGMTSPRTPQFNTISGPGVSSPAAVDAERQFATMPAPQTNGPTSPRTDEFGRTPRAGTGSPPPNTNRFTVHNLDESELPPASTDSLMRRPSAGPEPFVRAGGASGWATAEEEKARLYESAKAKASRLQAEESKPSAPAPVPASPPQPTRTPWLTAEEEKVRLYQSARAKAARLQEGADTSGHARSDSIGSQRGPATAQAGGSAGAGASSGVDPAFASPGAHLYHQAMAAVQRNASLGAEASPQRAMSLTPVRGPHPNYPTAEHEKAMLQRYHSAVAAVERTQADPYDEPAPYDALYPASPPPQPPTATAGGSSAMTNAYDEKTRMRNHYEAQDRSMSMPHPAPDRGMSTGMGADVGMPQPAPYASPQPAPYAAPQHASYAASPPADNSWAQPPPASPPRTTNGGAGSSALPSAEAEKELLRRRFESEDNGPRPSPPPRRAPSYTTPGPRPPPPAPPMSAPPNGNFQPLSAAEEKARLRAQYAQTDAPPLMPRPPPGYLQETREVDVRSQSGHGHDGYAEANGHDIDQGSIGTFGQPLPAIGNLPRPPLPPKPYDQ